MSHEIHEDSISSLIKEGVQNRWIFFFYITSLIFGFNRTTISTKCWNINIFSLSYHIKILLYHFKYSFQSHSLIIFTQISYKYIRVLTFQIHIIFTAQKVRSTALQFWSNVFEPYSTTSSFIYGFMSRTMAPSMRIGSDFPLLSPIVKEELQDGLELLLQSHCKKGGNLTNKISIHGEE